MNNYLEINGQNFPDRNFRQFVLNEFDDDHDGKLRAEDTAVVLQKPAGGLGRERLHRLEVLDLLRQPADKHRCE